MGTTEEALMEADAPPQKIVVGIDGSEESERALQWSAAEARLRGAVLEIVHAWAPPAITYGEPAVGPLPFDPTPYGDAASKLLDFAIRRAIEVMGEPGPAPLGSVVEGPAVPALLEASHDAALLVVGKRGAGGFRGLRLGSVAGALIHHAAVPTAVVGPSNPVGPVAVGIDDSPGGRAALAWAADEAVTHDVPLVLVHGWATPVAMPPGGLAFEPLPVGSHGAGTKRLAADLLAELRTAGRPVPGDVEVRAMSETAPRALIAISQEASLLVVGSRGRGPIAGLLLGSVSRQVVHHAECPVAVIPVGR